MKGNRNFNDKKKGYAIYDYFKKGKITAISEGISKNSNCYRKN